MNRKPRGDTPIAKLGLSNRATHALLVNGISRYDQLADYRVSGSLADFDLLAGRC